VGVPPLPVSSPCNKVISMVLGTGALFEVGFMSVAEACIKAGGSCGTCCSELHPPTQIC